MPLSGGSKQAVTRLRCSPRYRADRLLPGQDFHLQAVQTIAAHEKPGRICGAHSSGRNGNPILCIPQANVKKSIIEQQITQHTGFAIVHPSFYLAKTSLPLPGFPWVSYTGINSHKWVSMTSALDFQSCPCPFARTRPQAWLLAHSPYTTLRRISPDTASFIFTHAKPGRGLYIIVICMVQDRRNK